MNTSLFSSHFGLTVPASNIERLAGRVSAKGSIGRPYLGLIMQPVRLPEPLRAQSNAQIGLLVMGTEEGSPAEKAAFIIGDILVRLDQKTLNSTGDVHDLLTADSIGRELKAGILRGGSLQELTVIVGERSSRQRNE
jgi:S1-C subfamily serine protease